MCRLALRTLEFKERARIAEAKRRKQAKLQAPVPAHPECCVPGQRSLSPEFPAPPGTTQHMPRFPQLPPPAGGSSSSSSSSNGSGGAAMQT